MELGSHEKLALLWEDGPEVVFIHGVLVHSEGVAVASLQELPGLRGHFLLLSFSVVVG